MKIRLARIGNIGSIGAKGACSAALLFLLASTLPLTLYAQEKTDGARTSQPQADPAHSKSPGPGTPFKQNSGGKPAAAAISAGAITALKIVPEGSKLTVTVATDQVLAPREFLLENPARLVLDFPNTRNAIPVSQLPVKASPVKRIRIQQYQAEPTPIARMVFELADGCGPHQITADKESVRLVFHNTTAKPNLSVSLPAASLPARTGGNVARPPERATTSSIIPSAVAAPVEKSTSRADPAGKGTTPGAKAFAPPTASNLGAALARAEFTRPAPSKEIRPAAVEPLAKNPSAAAKPSVRSTEQKPVFPKVELPTAALVPAEAPAPPPLVAALPTSTAGPLKTTSPVPSRFSGQPLTLDLIDIPLVDFFRLMSEEGGINVVMDPEIKGRVSIKVVKVPWDQIFESVLTNNSLDKQVEGPVVRIARKSTLQEEAKQQESLKKANLLAADLETRIKRLNYAKANSLIKALEDQKTVRGTIVVEDRTNSLILTDIPSSISKLVSLIEALDVPQPQVEIEARIVSATRDFARDIGIQFGFVDGNLQRVTVGGPNTFGTIGGTRPSATPVSAFAAGNTRSGRGASDDSVSESAAISTGTSSTNKGNYNVNLPANKAFGGVGISIGNIFDTFLLDAAITAGESKGLAKLISQPKVTAQNNSPAVITQGLRFPVQIVANNTITVQFQNAALTLTVTPQITYEGNIVLDLKVENNTPDFGRSVNNIPSIRTSESTTRVLVSDGGTTVIGGILIDDEATREDKVPGLGSLPLVGNLFRRTSVSSSTQEVLFFVTPRVIK